MRAILIFIALFLAPVSIANTHGVGNPGNAFDSQMISACERAYNILQSEHWTSSNLPQDLKEFFEVHLSELKNQVKICRLRFTDSVLPIDLPGVDPSCARTNVAPELSNEPLDTIFISRTTCINQGIDADAALQLIIHENIHHLIDPTYSDRPDQRISDENFCNETASSIVRNWKIYLEEQEVKWSQLPQPSQRTQGRILHTSLFASDGMGSGSVIMWGGCYADSLAMFGCNRYLRNGLQFDLRSSQWSMTESFAEHDFKPDERAHHTAVWTGSDAKLTNKMVIWGGCNGNFSCFNSLGDGAIFDPAKKLWLPLNDDSTNRPSPRTFHSGVWTSKGMFIWGGLENFDSPTPGVSPTPVAGGAFWQPSSTVDEESRWLEIPTSGQPSARSHHATVFTGDDIYIWGGCKKFDLNSVCIEAHNDGARFNLATMQWYPLPSGREAPAARFGHQAFWTGSLLLIFGGENVQGTKPPGSIYSPELNKWYPMATQPFNAMSSQNTVWDKDRLISWGKVNGTSTQMFEYVPPAGEHLIFGGYWNARSIKNTRDASSAGTFVAIPSGIIHWGGESESGDYPTNASLLHY